MIHNTPWITTDVSPRVCRCGAVVLRGVAEGITVTVDPWPADDRVTEVLALLDHRWTFTLINRHLFRREGSTRSGHVMIQHRCGHVLTSPQPPPADQQDPDIPPF